MNEMIPTRNGYGDGLVELGKKNDKVVVLCADLTESTRVEKFAELFPERFFEVGVAEQNMAGVASGLAVCGKIAFISSYAMFSPGRNWEQIRTTIAYNDANVKIAGAHAGISVGPDGATHQAVEDVAIMRAMPNMKVIVPCDYLETKKATIAAANVFGPVYIRFGRSKTPVMTNEKSVFVIGKANVLATGTDVALIGCGPVLSEVLLAAEQLAKHGLSSTVINCHTIKPIDRQTIVAAAKQCGCVVTVEEHQITGGLGGAVCEVLSEECPVPVIRVGIPDCFGETGEPEQLWQKFGLTAENIVHQAKRAIENKNSGFYMEAADFRGDVSRIAKPDKYFHVFGGGVIRSLPELAQKVERMEDRVFSHHVNHSKNDFCSWVNDVFHDSVLANLLRVHQNKREMVSVIRKRLEGKS